ncbi:elongation factor P 5-aminopentanone reductase [Metabacillus halosaccharovorans]|uniref:elongation factor P 5-aminopentanone reductase n=1 Tax=Metabacillus halosaccharovorans TaxID=930124 RepID=UPI001C1FF326|nr:SDR family oxidoreductase [Metabacillus halosaccharovorans]MBU7592185.1 SDR family oxidoreductase [Metabacillus halosaccharovorans]
MEKYALVTGASGGIGTAIVKKLIKDGYIIYVHYNQNVQAIEELKIYSNNIIPVQADLTVKTGVEALLEQIQMPIELLVLNSGISLYGLVTDLHDDDIDNMVQLHITSPFKLVQQLIPSMIRKKSGNIIVISSIWGITGASCEVLYSMVKGGQNAYVKALAKELAPSKIRVNAVAPGAVSTKMLSHFTEEEIRGLSEEIPLGRLGQPEEIANTVSFLASENASYITGQVISVNGGWI